MASINKSPRLLETSDIIMASPPAPVLADVLLKVQDISQKAGLPPHIQYLMTVKGDQDFISIHEWAARLCHALIVEAGFFPAFDGPPDIAVREALEMPDEIRIPRNVKKLTPELMFSDRGVYVLKYRAILMELVDVPGTESVDQSSIGVIPPVDTKTVTKPDDGSSTELNEVQEFKDPQEWRYRFSEDINVTMVILEDRVLLTASYNPEGGSRSLTHQVTMNIEEFLILRARMIPLRLRADQWIKKFDLNSTRFSGFFKNKFAIYLMDKMNGVVFERRGLVCLPDLVLFKILKMSSVRVILNMGMTCTQLYNVVREDRLWQYTLKRDFPIVDAHPGASTNNTLLLDQVTSETTKKKDHYEIYKQKYVARHRGINRLNSFPVRFYQPDFPRTRRFPSHPFPFVRF